MSKINFYVIEQKGSTLFNKEQYVIVSGEKVEEKTDKYGIERIYLTNYELIYPNESKLIFPLPKEKLSPIKKVTVEFDDLESAKLFVELKL